MLRESDLDPFFDEATSQWFRFEALHAYDVSIEQPRLRAYLAGEPYNPADEPTDWLNEIQERVNSGIDFRKVRVMRGPLTPYERWECEWSYPATELAGQRTFILDLAEVSLRSTLPYHDWWMFDETTVLTMHYADGRFAGAEETHDPAVVVKYIQHRDAALAAATPFPDYWTAHPQYWRENWIGSPE